MQLKEYRTWVKRLRIDRQAVSEKTSEAAYLALGLVCEAGEVAQLIKKMLRDGKLDIEDLQLELGDVFYYFTALSDIYFLSQEDIMEENIKKLNKRREEGTLVRR